MKKQIYCALLICLLASLVGCQKEEESVTTEQAESYEHIEQFPEVIDIASYLEVEAEEVNVLNEETDRLVLCFHHEEDSQTTPSIKSYEQLLIDDDYTGNMRSRSFRSVRMKGRWKSGKRFTAIRSIQRRCRMKMSYS